VADTLEQRLNDKLAELRASRERLVQIQAAQEPLSDDQRQRLEQLGRDFSRVWNHPKAAAVLKEQLLRAAIFEIIVTHQPEHQRLELVVHWQGGVHTRLHVKKRVTPVGSKTDPSLVETVEKLSAQGLSDAEIYFRRWDTGGASPRMSTGLLWLQCDGSSSL